jgi:hypothetical protein
MSSSVNCVTVLFTGAVFRSPNRNARGSPPIPAILTMSAVYWSDGILPANEYMVGLACPQRAAIASCIYGRARLSPASRLLHDTFNVRRGEDTVALPQNGHRRPAILHVNECICGRARLSPASRHCMMHSTFGAVRTPSPYLEWTPSPCPYGPLNPTTGCRRCSNMVALRTIGIRIAVRESPFGFFASFVFGAHGVRTAHRVRRLQPQRLHRHVQSLFGRMGGSGYVCRWR